MSRRSRTAPLSSVASSSTTSQSSSRSPTLSSPTASTPASPTSPQKSTPATSSSATDKEGRLPSLLCGGGETSESPALCKGGSPILRPFVGALRRYPNPRRAAEIAEVSQRNLWPDGQFSSGAKRRKQRWQSILTLSEVERYFRVSFM